MLPACIQLSLWLALCSQFSTEDKKGAEREDLALCSFNSVLYSLVQKHFDGTKMCGECCCCNQWLHLLRGSHVSYAVDWYVLKCTWWEKEITRLKVIMWCLIKSCFSFCDFRKPSCFSKHIKRNNESSVLHKNLEKIKCTYLWRCATFYAESLIVIGCLL